jgi:hypothetical protein
MSYPFRPLPLTPTALDAVAALLASPTVPSSAAVGTAFKAVIDELSRKHCPNDGDIWPDATAKAHARRLADDVMVRLAGNDAALADVIRDWRRADRAEIGADADALMAASEALHRRARELETMAEEVA